MIEKDSYTIQIFILILQWKL